MLLAVAEIAHLGPVPVFHSV